MNFLRPRLTRLAYQFANLIDGLSDDDLEIAWSVLESVYCDLYMLRAIHESKRTVQPGDTMNYEEAVRVLHLP